MKRLFAIIRHPRLYHWFRKTQERMVVLNAACKLLEIQEPTVWDVDRIHNAMCDILGCIHRNPRMFHDMPIIEDNLYWTILMSKFKRLSISREETKRVLDEYDFTIQYLGGTGKNPTMVDVVSSHVMMVKLFPTLV